MRWGDMRSSGNLEDREASGPGRLGGGLKVGGLGLVAVLAISYFLGLNPLDVLDSLQNGSSPSAPARSSALTTLHKTTSAGWQAV